MGANAINVNGITAEIPDGNVREFNEAQPTSFDCACPRRETHSHGWSWAIPP